MSTAPAALQILTAARDLHQGLIEHKATSGSLAPCDATNHLFSSLVRLALTPANTNTSNSVMQQLANDEILGELYQLCAQGEYEMEHYWGERIRTAPNPMAELRSFPYWQNYLKLARLEVNALRQACPDMKKILFVGAGPLPLTAFIMAKHYGLDVTNLDIDGDATCCASAWMERILGVNNLPCHHIDVMNYTDFSQYDVIVLAALVGLDSETKTRVLGHIHKHFNDNQTLLVRSVHGMRRLLYPEIMGQELAGFEVTRSIHPRGEVVNSVIVARKAA